MLSTTPPHCSQIGIHNAAHGVEHEVGKAPVSHFAFLSQQTSFIVANVVVARSVQVVPVGGATP